MKKGWHSTYGSDTFSLCIIIGVSEYVMLSGDITFGKQYWNQIVRGLFATCKFVDHATGLFVGTKTSDYGRIRQDGQNTALNAIYYHALNIIGTSSKTVSPNNAQFSQWPSMAAKVKSIAE